MQDGQEVLPRRMAGLHAKFYHTTIYILLAHQRTQEEMVK